MSRSRILIRCTSEAPWTCALHCRGCGHQAVAMGPHGSSNHRAILTEAADHHCPEG